jgi:hypothetical protein
VLVNVSLVPKHKGTVRLSAGKAKLNMSCCVKLSHRKGYTSQNIEDRPLTALLWEGGHGFESSDICT